MQELAERRLQRQSEVFRALQDLSVLVAKRLEEIEKGGRSR